MPVQQVSGGGDKGSYLGDNSRGSSAVGERRGGSSSSSRTIARGAPNLKSSSFRKLKNTVVSTTVTKAAMGRQEKESDKQEGKERHKPEVADLGLLGHWQQQQKQQRPKANSSCLTLLPLGSA